MLLDGDVLRSGLNRDLGFSNLDRIENLRRAAEVAKILADTGHTVIASFITPLESIREAIRSIFDPERFAEVFLDCPLETCEERDPKGLYCRARAGDIPEFTGISSPFQVPANADLIVPTGRQRVEDSLSLLLGYVEERFPDVACSEIRDRTGPLVRTRPRVVVLGLDGAPPSLVFDRLAPRLPMFRRLRAHGCWGTLRSTDPPLTVPAWTSMTTGRDPGELGLYGFRNRFDHTYRGLVTADASHVRAVRVWEHLERAGKKSTLIGVPQTYPPRPHNGVTVAGFLAPRTDQPFTYPPSLAHELTELAGGPYRTDVDEFRTSDREELLGKLYEMADRRFTLAEELIIRNDWDFLMMVEIATDRLHHAFWRFSTPDHPLHEPNNPYETAIADFYAYLDRRIASLVSLLDDETTLLIVSDHGTRNMTGGVCINEWLIQRGLLTLRKTPDIEQPLHWDMIDWPHTRAWGEGGYYGRIFFNVKGREPEGIIEPDRYEAFRDELAQALVEMVDPEGRLMINQVLKPDQVYRSCANVPPDLMVYFDNLDRRSIATVGGGNTFCDTNSTGPDDANHDLHGMIVMTRLRDLRSGTEINTEWTDASLLDVAPTIVHEYGLSVPVEMNGNRILGKKMEAVVAEGPRKSRTPKTTQFTEQETDQAGYSPEEEELVKKRLRDLGYI